MVIDRMTELAAISSTPPAAPPAGFAVTAEVWAGVRKWPTCLHRLCALCGRSINIAAYDDVAYQYTPQELEGLVLAHLIQSHGWTRESISET